MHKYSKKFRTIWANFDANRHMRHTAYNDYAAELRVIFLEDFGFNLEFMEKLKIGPILFREETKFLREIKMGTDITIDLVVSGLSKDGGRFSFKHHIYNQEGKLSAVVVVDGAWIDLEKRKLCLPPEEMTTAMIDMEKSEDFEWIDKSKKQS